MDGNAPKIVSRKVATTGDLADTGLISPAAADSLTPVAEQFGVAITPQIVRQIDPSDPEDPLAAQFVPDLRELEDHADDVADPIGDHSHAPVKGIIHRYPDRLLLTPVHVCPVYCRFCFRREDVSQHQMLTDSELDAALDYIHNDTNIWEVILSGGDPLMLSARRMQNLLARLREIDHVKIIRIHTRVPVVAPDRVTAELTQALADANPVYVVIHTNHSNEFSTEAIAACAQLADAGIPLLSQTVLLKGVNDAAETLGELFRLLAENRIKPYYLHHADRTKGTAHFRTTVAEGQSIVRELRGNYSGLCQPEYVLDIPGGYGKSPLSGPYAEPADEGWQVTDYQGDKHHYPEEG